MKKILLLLFFYNFFLPAQDNELNFPEFTISFKENNLTVSDKNDNLLYQKIFDNPTVLTSDLDEDGNEEFLIIDSTADENASVFIVYLFNTIDSFYLVDSILSGGIEPFSIVPEEIGLNIIVAGNPAFQFFNNNSEIFLPLNCWRFEGNEIFLINDEIYELFLEESEAIVDYLDEGINQNISGCDFSFRNKAAIASAYANYINAGEESVASQFLKKYYLCNDIEEFKTQLRKLIIGKTNEDGLE